MDRSVRYVGCLVFGVVFAMAMSRLAPTPVATLADGFASRIAVMEPLRRRAGFEADG